MQKKTLLALALICLCATALAQDNKETFLWRIDRIFNLSSIKNIDTNYYSLAPRGWMVNINNNFGTVGIISDIKNVPALGNTHLSAQSQLNYQIGATAGYRNLILGYSFIHPAGNAKDALMFIAANAWGVEYRKMVSDDFIGTAENSLSGNLNIRRGDIRTEQRYLRAYHVFNPRRFSMTAAGDQRCIQKQSAGSVLFYSNFARNILSFQNSQLKTFFGGMERMEFTSAAVGLGYGYNYTPNQGRLLFHLSAVPMLVAVMGEDFTVGGNVQQERASHLLLSLIGRFTANYRFNDHLGINLTAVYNNLGTRTVNDMKTTWNDLFVRAALCVRF